VYEGLHCTVCTNSIQIGSEFTKGAIKV